MPDDLLSVMKPSCALAMPPTIPQRLTWLSRPRPRSFGCLQHPILARFDASILSNRFDRPEPVPQQFAHCRRAARHPVAEPKIIDCLEFVRRQHDLQSLFPHQSAPALAILHPSALLTPVELDAQNVCLTDKC